MKKLLLGLLCLVAMEAYAQDTLKKSSSIGDFDEQYMVLKSDKKAYQGAYKLTYREKLVASGNYDKGKKVGLWTYYTNEQPVQQYDYTANKLISNKPDRNITYQINSYDGDSVINPVKVGSYIAGLKLLSTYAKFDDNISGLTGKIIITHNLGLNADGNLTSWIATVHSDEGVKVITQSTTDIPEDAMLFLPAVVNGKKIASTLTFVDYVMPQGGAMGEAYKGRTSRGKKRN